MSEVAPPDLAAKITSLGVNVAVTFGFEYSLDGHTWKKFAFFQELTSDPLYNLALGFGNGIKIRYSFYISQANCQNPFLLTTNTASISGIDTQPLSGETFFSNFLLRIQQFSKNSAYANVNFQNILNGKQALSSLMLALEYPVSSNQVFALQNLNNAAGTNFYLVGISPIGCVKATPEDMSKFNILSVPCDVGIIGSLPNPPSANLAVPVITKGSLQPFYKVVEVVSAKKFNDNTFSGGQPSKVKPNTRLLSWSCVRGKSTLKFIGKVMVCPLGYKITK